MARILNPQLELAGGCWGGWLKVCALAQDSSNDRAEGDPANLAALIDCQIRRMHVNADHEYDIQQIWISLNCLPELARRCCSIYWQIVWVHMLLCCFQLAVTIIIDDRPGGVSNDWFPILSQFHQSWQVDAALPDWGLVFLAAFSFLNLGTMRNMLLRLFLLP